MTADRDQIVLLSHGGGGTRTQGLIDGIIRKHIGNPILDQLDDSATLDMDGTHIALTTDSFVVEPIFFPGGDIGVLAACGTINDLAMQGADPKHMTLALILEEGLALSDLDKLMGSFAAVLAEAGVQVVTGDTKVVERGLGTGIAINTSGIGVIRDGVDVHVSNAKPGDVVIVNGFIGDHGITIMSCREGLNFEADLKTDAAPLNGMTAALLDAVPSIHCLRDPTRGGVAAAVCDIASRSGVSVLLDEAALPVRPEVAGACSMLGLEPLNVANEGKAIIVCSEEDSAKVLETLKADPLGGDAVIIGTVSDSPEGMVLLQTRAGGKRIVEVPSGEDLPRIC